MSKGQNWLSSFRRLHEPRLREGVMRAEGQGTLTTLKPGGFPPGALQLPCEALPPTLMTMTAKPRALYQGSNDDTLSPAAPRKRAEMRTLSCPTWKTQPRSPKQRAP